MLNESHNKSPISQKTSQVSRVFKIAFELWVTAYYGLWEYSTWLIVSPESTITYHSQKIVSELTHFALF